MPSSSEEASPFPDEDLQVGQVLGSYRVVRKLGEGGMGVVFEAVHERINDRVAIKVLRRHHSRDPDTAHRFINEARAANAIGHSGIIHIFEMGQLPEGNAFLIMEYVEGQSLHARLQQRGRALGAMAAVHLGQQIAAVLAVAHDHGVVHRDLKPDNIMLIPDPLLPGGDRIKILDFGLAKVLYEDPEENARRTRSGTLLGTPIYMSPEQCRGSAQVDEKADVYSLGVMLYEILAGRTPFQALHPGELIAMHLRDPPPALQQVKPGLPEDLVALVHRMLAKGPEQRPPMTEVAATLETFKAATLSPARDAPRFTLRATGPIVTALYWLLGFGVLCVPILALHRWFTSPPAPGHPQPGMVLIPGGTFAMGSTKMEIDQALSWCQRVAGDECLREQYEREQPVRQVRISSFFLDTTEVTNEQFASWLNRQAGIRVVDGRLVQENRNLLADLYLLADQSGLTFSAGRFTVREGFLRKPVTQITWDAAQSYCKEMGKRLPTEAEWEYAARGAEGRRFPWGDADPRCDAVVLGRTKGQKCQHMGAGPADVGTAAQDVTLNGVFDLAGNVEEWTMDWFQPRYSPCGPGCIDPVVTNPEARDEPDLRVVRGGSWYGPPVRATTRFRLRREQAGGNIGFRCVKPAGP